MSFQLALHVVDDPLADREVVDVVVLDRLDVTEPADDLADDVLLEGGRVLRQAHPDIAEPFPHGHAHQAVLGAADVGHLGEVGRGDELAVQAVRPGVVGALEGPLDLAGLLRAELGATVPADVEVGADRVVPRPGHEDALAARRRRSGRRRASPVRTRARRRTTWSRICAPAPGRRSPVRVGGAGEGGDQTVRQAGRGHGALLGETSWWWDRSTGDGGSAPCRCAPDSGARGILRRQPSTGARANHRATAANCLRQRMNSRGWFIPSTATGCPARR